LGLGERYAANGGSDGVAERNDRRAFPFFSSLSSGTDTLSSLAVLDQFRKRPRSEWSDDGDVLAAIRADEPYPDPVQVRRTSSDLGSSCSSRSFVEAMIDNSYSSSQDTYRNESISFIINNPDIVRSSRLLFLSFPPAPIPSSTGNPSSLSQFGQ
jgi:hypothetical protein